MLFHFIFFFLGTEENSDIIDDAVIYLLRLFLDENIVMMKHLSDLKKIFGVVSTQTANKICDTIIQISPLLTDNCRDRLKIISDDNNDKIIDEKQLWGKDIKCKLPELIFSDLNLLQVSFL